jgi:hypothetical protein
LLWLIPPSAVLDMRYIALLLDKHMNIPTIIRFVGTEVLSGRGTLDQDRQDQSGNRPLVMLVRTGHMDGQWRSSLVNQDVDLASQFSPIRRILSGIFPSQGSRAVPTIDRLPNPADMTCASVVSEHGSQDVFEDALVRPGLETFMNDTAGHAEPVPLDRLPLATGPQHKPDAIQDRTITGTRSASPRPLVTGQVSLHLTPQLTGHSTIANIFRLSRFCGTLAHGVSPLLMGLGHHIYSGIRLFSQVPEFPDRLLK